MRKQRPGKATKKRDDRDRADEIAVATAAAIILPVLVERAPTLDLDGLDENAARQVADAALARRAWALAAAFVDEGDRYLAARGSHG